jgi:hypothetical protein
VTTIAANLREMAGDTRVTWEGIGTDAFAGVKLFPAKNGAIYGVTGGDCTGSIRALEWLQGDRPLELKPHPPEYEHGWDWRIIELSPEGIAVYNVYLERDPTLEPLLAVGSGRKVAMYCMKYLHMSPAEAVREACRVDDHSDSPIYVASLAVPKVVRWNPPKRAKIKGSTPKGPQ